MTHLTPQQIDAKLEKAQITSDPEDKFQQAKFLYTESLNINYQIGIIASLVLQSKALIAMGKLSTAIEYLDKASPLCERVSPNQWVIGLYSAYGRVYRDLGSYDSALENHLRALETATEINDESLMMMEEGNIGVVALTKGDYQKSIEAFLDVLKYAEKMEHQKMQLDSYVNLSAAYHFNHDYDNAIQAAKNALLLADNDQNRMSAHGNLGVSYADLGNFDHAQFHLKMALDIARTMPKTISLCICLVDLADYHIKVHEDEKAIVLLQEGLDVADALGFKMGMKDCHERLHKLYRNQQDWQQALYHHEQLHQLDRAMFNDKSDARIRNLETLHKVTKLREANERQQEEFDALTQLKDTLLSDFSHDLKNPLSIIRTSLYLHKRSTQHLNNGAGLNTRYIEQIENQAERMIKLITDVLDIARFNTGLGLDLQHLDLNAVIQDSYALFYEQIRAKDITFTSQYESRCYIHADSNAMSRVFTNIIGNAVKYSPSGGYIDVKTVQLRNGYVRVCITNSGEHIPETELPRIFDRFYRASTNKTTAEGTGLGLAIVKSIIEQHNGTIDVESQADQGTTFIVTLPCG